MNEEKEYEVGLSVVMVDTVVVKAKNKKEAVERALEEADGRVMNQDTRPEIDYVDEI
jgi:hypothetical protein